MRVGVVDIGTNSTRLLAADVAPEGVTVLDRESIVTRLGQGVDATGRLADEAMDRVRDALTQYRERLDALRTERDVAVLTSAVRDAANGPAFVDEVASRFGLRAQVLAGDEEARLTFLGATSERDPDDPTAVVVIDIGGGSTELVEGHGRRMDFHVSTQAGVVRQTERHIKSDPPRHEELEALADDVRAVYAAAVPDDVRAAVDRAIAVAGTATSLAAIDLELDPYDPERVHGHTLMRGRIEELLARLAQMPLAERRKVTGLHPDRAPTIVAGCVLLIEALRLFGLQSVEISEHDILRGAAIAAVG
ncbi:MAG: Ppx/GppA family phosphatase [Actinobacteria bacterium]|nr:MAG: Ppx/GppA family phosphatase [Actinomycetota bacterium]